MDLENIYNQLTNVDIVIQKQIWDERGKGYYGEYLLFCELYKSITGNCKILMNLTIPVEHAKTTEIDLLIVHETGLYVFEIKHYKGIIYGKNTDANWTQYFRTVKNNTFRNPIDQNKYHIDALKVLFPDTPIHSVIVFTHPECDVRITNEDAGIDVCRLINVRQTLEYRFTKCTDRYSISEINDIFEKLSCYSQMQNPITIDGTEASFFSWVQPVITKLEEKKDEVVVARNKLLENTEKLNRIKVKGIIFNIVIAIICVVVSIFVSGSIIQNNNAELAEFKQNFLHVDEIGNEYIDTLKSYVDVSNVSLSPLSDDAVTFTARIAMKNDVYGIAFTKNSKYIVMTTSGIIFEYSVFGPHLNYNWISNRIGSGIRAYKDLDKAQFFGISNIDDISYIKITGVELFKLNISKTTVKDKLEIELYSK